MEIKIAELRERFGAVPEALRQLAGLQAEIDLFRAHGDTCGYVFYVCLRGEVGDNR